MPNVQMLELRYNAAFDKCKDKHNAQDIFSQTNLSAPNCTCHRHAAPHNIMMQNSCFLLLMCSTQPCQRTCLHEDIKSTKWAHLITTASTRHIAMARAARMQVQAAAICCHKTGYHDSKRACLRIAFAPGNPFLHSRAASSSYSWTARHACV